MSRAAACDPFDKNSEADSASVNLGRSQFEMQVSSCRLSFVFARIFVPASLSAKPFWPAEAGIARWQIFERPF
jgi:hypothetical protein